MILPLPGDIFHQGQLLNNTYEIEGVIGRGGTGEVYRARNQVSGRVVAVKALSRQFSGNEDYVELMRREEQMRDISHDAVVRYTECSRSADGHVFLVMDHIDGPSLQDEMRRRPIGPRELLVVAHRVAEGLEAAHRRGIVHRDLSPDNVILRGADAEQATLIDFGIAKDTAAGARTIVGNDFAGKYEYAAPEQLEGKSDQRSDLYALGASLLAAFRGEVPFAGATPGEIVRRKRQPLDVADVPEPLRGLIGRLAAPEPANRPASAAEALRLIEDALSIGQGKPNPRERARRGDRGLDLLAAAVALLLVAGAGGLWWTGRLDGLQLGSRGDAPPERPGERAADPAGGEDPAQVPQDTAPDVPEPPGETEDGPGAGTGTDGGLPDDSPEGDPPPDRTEERPPDAAGEAPPDASAATDPGTSEDEAPETGAPETGTGDAATDPADPLADGGEDGRPPADLPLADPYRLAVAVAGGEASLSGDAPDPAAAQALREAVGAAAGPVPLDEGLRLAAGAPSERWAQDMAALIRAAGGLAEWRLEAKGPLVQVAGLAPSAAARDRIASSLGAQAEQGGLTLELDLAAGPQVLRPEEVAAALAEVASCGPLLAADPPEGGWRLGETVRVRGDLAAPGEAERVTASLASVVGDRPVTMEAQVLNEDLCAVRALLPPLPTAAMSIRLSEGATAEANLAGVFRVGDNPVVDVDLPASVEGWLWVILVDNTGEVFNLLPNIALPEHRVTELGEVANGLRRIRVLFSTDEFRADSTRLAFRISEEDFGKSEVIALLSREPLFPMRRPRDESVESFAQGLREALEADPGNLLAMASRLLEARP